MESKKGVEDQKVDFRGPEESKNLEESRKTKCFIVLVITAVLLVSASIALAVVFLTKPDASENLVDVNLEEGDTLMYRVDQRFEVKRNDTDKETITSIAGFRVVKKTTDAYWFLLKINTTIKTDKDEKAVFGYFRVRLARTETSSDKQTVNEAIESYELHGYPETDGEFVRYLHGLLYQLLPAVRRDLYEDVDGQTDHKLKAENSPLLPGPVMMHRQADTKQNGKVLINNHFNRSDLVNASSDIDLDVKYTDSSAINKSNGMISESNVQVTEQLHFGEPMKTKDGRDITMMNVSLFSHVIRIEMDRNFFVEEEIKGIEIHLFVKLVLPNTESTVMDKTTATNTSPSNDSNDGQQLSTQLPITVKRHRRAAGVNLTSPKNFTRTATPHLGGGGDGSGNGSRLLPTSVPTQVANSSLSNPTLLLRSLSNSHVSIGKTFSLFDKKIIGIRTKGEGNVWLRTVAAGNGTNTWELGSELYVMVGSIKATLYHVKYSNEEMEKGIGKEINRAWRRGIPFCFRALIVKLCVEFSLRVRINVKPPKLVPEETSVSPPKITFLVEPFGEVIASVEAYASVLLVRGGVFVDGTIVRATVPTKLSYNSVKPPQQQWCLAANVRLTALEIHAGLFYQWRRCRLIIRWFYISFRCWWGARRTLLSFGRSAAVRRNFKLYEHCFA